jgi:excisionase family DNA binding protein
MAFSKYKDYDELPLILTVEQVGEVLGISRASAYNLARSSNFPTIRIGRRMLVPKGALINWIEREAAEA